MKTSRLIIKAITILLTISLISVSCSKHKTITGLKLIVTSDDPIEQIRFDACIINDRGERKDSLDLTTPFSMDIKSRKISFLFKKNSGNSRIKYNIALIDTTNIKHTWVSAIWPTSVILIDGDKIEMFGLK